MSQYYTILIPMLLVSAVTMFLFSWGADRGWGRQLAATAFFILILSALLLFRPQTAGLDPAHLTALFVPGTLFLVGFTALEPILPSLVSKSAPEGAYGTALGSFHTLQYLGSAAGGAMAGALAHLPSSGIMTALMVASLAGFLLMLSQSRSREPEARGQESQSHTR